jgi:predicted DNA-binding transcriptional regulator YafY
VATLLFLQARGTVTAAEVADELEVSERTARRDLDALSAAGIPIFSRRGRGGGWELVGGARTDLTGLRSAEARALLTMAAAAGPSIPELSVAIRKLVQALPAPQRNEAERTIASIVTDTTRWGAGPRPPSEPERLQHLEPLQLAVIERRRVDLTYDTPRRGVSTRPIEPLGLVVKQGRWYVLAMTELGRRSFRVDRVVDVGVLDERFEPPTGFDLAAAWEEITTGYVESSNRFTTEARLEPWVIGPLRSMGVDVVVRADGGGPDGRVAATLGAWNAQVLAAEIAGVISGIELLDAPEELHLWLATIGENLVSRFGAQSDR